MNKNVPFLARLHDLEGINGTCHLDSTLTNEMDVSMTPIDPPASESVLQSESDNTTGGSTGENKAVTVVTDNRDEEDMDTEDFFDAVDTPENLLTVKFDDARTLVNDEMKTENDKVETSEDKREEPESTILETKKEEEQTHVQPSSPPLPAKGSYDIDFDNLDDFNPFQTKSAVANSPLAGTKSQVPTVKCNQEAKTEVVVTPEKGEKSEEETCTSPEEKSRRSLSGLQKISDNPFLKLIDSPAVKEQDQEDRRKQALDDLIQTEGEDLMSQSFEDIDPFKTKSQIPNSPVKKDDEFFSGVCEPEQQKIKTEGDDVEEESLDAAIKAADESFSNSILENDNKANDMGEIDPFATKSQIPNSPALCKTSEPSEFPTISEAEDPFKASKQIPNSPACQKVGSENEHKISFDVLSADDPFKVSNKVANSPNVRTEIVNTDISSDGQDIKDVEHENKTIDDNPFRGSKDLENSPCSTQDNTVMTWDSTVDNTVLCVEEDPFKTKCKVTNSPVNAKTTGENTDRIVDGEFINTSDPFKTNNKVANSPVVQAKEESDPFTTKSKVANSPVPKKEETLSEHDVDPFKTKNNVANSTVLKKEEAVLESDVDPFKTKSNVANSPPAHPNKIRSECDADPFKTKSKVANSPTAQEEVVSQMDLDPFQTKSKVGNSPAVKQESHVPSTDEVKSAKSSSIDTNVPSVKTKSDPLDELDPFKTKSCVANSPQMTNGKDPSSEVEVSAKKIGSDNPFKTPTQKPQQSGVNDPFRTPTQKSTESDVSCTQLPNGNRSSKKVCMYDLSVVACMLK